jgi:hypothetical protein
MVNVDAALSRLGLTRLRLGSFGIMPPPEPPLADLVRESEHQAARARQARVAAGLEQGHDADLPPVREGWLSRIEGPSLDPVVFGEGPW